LTHPGGRYSNFKVFTVYIRPLQVKISVGLIFIFFNGWIELAEFRKIVFFQIRNIRFLMELDELYPIIKKEQKTILLKF
jgi:hypothetical protein